MRFIHEVVCRVSPFLFSAVYYSTIGLYHNVFIQLLLGIWVAPCGVITNSAAMKILYIFWWILHF